MWKIDINDSSDLYFAVTCLIYRVIDIKEFKLWLFKVVKDLSIENIPDYIFDLIDFNESLFHIANIIGFAPCGELSDNDKKSLYGIAFARGVGLYDSPVTRKEALRALKNNPKILDEFKRFFSFYKIA